MPIGDSELALLRHPRLAALATSAWPAWLWSVDGSRMLWANAAGAAMFGAASVSVCTRRRFDVTDATATQIVRLAATLPTAAQERLERLRGFGSGFGSGFGRALTCACARIVVDGKSAVLIAATEPAGPALTLTERVRRLFVDDGDAIAASAADGTLIYANAAAQTGLAGVTTLPALGIDALAATAMEKGSASGTTRLAETPYDIAALRLGKDAARVLVFTFRQRTAETPPAPIQPPPTQPAPSSAAIAENIPQVSPEAPPETPSEVLEPVIAKPPVAPPTEPATAHPQTAPDESIADRRHPLRFVWHMDADGRFGVGSDEFVELVGPRTMAAFGRLWSEIAGELKLDPDNQVAHALVTRDTWSGIVISWPVDDTSERLPVELSGLPVFDRDRSFRGYRGFGVCRDIDRINQLARTRREHLLGFMAAPEAAPQPAEAATTPSAPIAPNPAETNQPEATQPTEAVVPPAAAEAIVPPAAAEAAPQPDRAAMSVAPSAANVVPFRQSPPPEPKVPPTLSPVERRAFRELAQELTARLRGAQQAPAAAESEQPPEAEIMPAPVTEQALLDRIPIGILLYRHDGLLYANRHFLEWSGYDNLGAIGAAGGLNRLFAEPGTNALAAATGGTQSLSILTQRGDKIPVEGRMFTVPWNGSSALALILTNGQAEAAQRSAEHASSAAATEIRELKSMLDAAGDGLVTLDPEGRIVAANASAAALFERPANDLAGRALGELFAPESERAAREYFDRVRRDGSVYDHALEVAAQAGGGRLVFFTMTISRVGSDRFCAVFRDSTARKLIEDELRNAKREVSRAAAAKAEFLARVSHEIRTPLNAITGFAEVIMAERFGPIGNERYREYVKDMHSAGTHLAGMLNDLLDLSRIESGQVELNFTNVNLTDLTQQCVGIMQPQANRARIIIRTALTPNLPLVVADERSLRQIVLNLISNSIRFTGPGGQVIVSTVFSDAREAVLRVRDTSVGISEKDIQAALEPFQQTITSASWGSGGTGFGLPLTKALAEANRANFSFKSALNAGTLVEIAFPPSRIVAN